MSDTPRTDAFEALVNRPTNWWDFARELERENARLRMELDASCNAEELRQVRFENAALRAERDALLELVSEAYFSTVDASTYPDGPCIERHIRKRMRAAIDAARKEAQP